MNYEKKYKESMAKMSKFLAKHDGFTISKDGEMYKELSEIFDELKESKDERIWLINYLSNRILNSSIIAENENLKKAIAWLEKQGQVKNSAISQHENKTCKESDDSLTSEDERMLNQLHSWMKEFGGAEEYTEKVYQWVKGLLEKQGGQKPAWSEDDDVGLGDAMWAIEQARTIAKDENDIGNLWCAERWLKALKDRVQPKQWLSKEDEEIILKMMFVFTTRVFPSSEECGSFVDFLKSLKPTWKPSEEEMKALAYALSLANNCGEEYAFDLRTLQDQLKKLK